MNIKKWRTHNPAGSKRVIVTKLLPGSLWLERLIRADCKVEVCTSADLLSVEDIKTAMGQQCDAVLGQLTDRTPKSSAAECHGSETQFRDEQSGSSKLFVFHL